MCSMLKTMLSLQSPSKMVDVCGLVGVDLEVSAMHIRERPIDEGPGPLSSSVHGQGSAQQEPCGSQCILTGVGQQHRNPKRGQSRAVGVNSPFVHTAYGALGVTRKEI